RPPGRARVPGGGRGAVGHRAAAGGPVQRGCRARRRRGRAGSRPPGRASPQRSALGVTPRARRSPKDVLVSPLSRVLLVQSPAFGCGGRRGRMHTLARHALHTLGIAALLAASAGCGGGDNPSKPPPPPSGNKVHPPPPPPP